MYSDKSPLCVRVILTTSDEVQALRAQVAQLKADLAALQSSFERAEYLYRCETLINCQLVDLCKAEGIVIPRRLFNRPDSVRGS